MPQLSDLVNKPKFVKKAYRPWDLTGSGTIDNKDKAPEVIPESAPKPPVNKTAIINKPEEKNPIYTDELTGNITSNKQVTTGEQTGNKQVTSRKQQGNIGVTNRKHPDNDSGNESVIFADTAERLVYITNSIKKLSGIQKSIFLYIINLCSARGVLDTGNILSTDLANAGNCSIGSAKTSLIRLIEKNLVFRLEGKPSRGGYMVLGITRDLQAATIQAQKDLFNPLKRSVTGNESGNTISPYSSSYKNNITTTSLPEEWKKINFESLEHIGFCETQLRQLYDGHMTEPEIIQDSINRFAYSLEYSEKTKAYNDPLNVLMGLLRKGKRWVESNYVSPKELAMRQILEEKRKQKEHRDVMIKELIDLEFPEWKRKLTDAEIREIVPAEVLKTNLSAAIHASLRSYFTEKIILPRVDENN